MINTLHIGLSYKCNLRCKHCFVDARNDRLTVEDCLNIIDTLIYEGLFVVIYTYGEPLLWPSFFELAENVKKRNVVQVLMTNGTMIDSETSKKIKDVGINTVYVSVDSGDAQQHDLNRGCTGTFQKAMNAIEELSKIGVKTGIATTVTETNCMDLESIYDIFKRHNLCQVSYLRERQKGTMVGKFHEGYYEFFKEHIGEIGKTMVFHDASLNPIINDYYVKGIITREHMELLLDMNRCKNSNTLCIYPNGDMSKCNFSKKLPCNYFEINLQDYIKSEEFVHENSICSSQF